MTFEQIRQAIEGRMSTWEGVPVAYDGVPNGPLVQAAIDAKESWVRCIIDHGDSIPAGNDGSPCVRRTGIMKCQIFTPENRGSRPTALLADSLASHFEYYQNGNFETQTASAHRVGPSDGWYMYVLKCPFRAG